ncbi:putative exosome complex exonuclease [Neospora caninum Liverpool]|uniref:Ribosomal RNA-processing protein 42 n=1 Tax=Neospora caninum (strain Liverpool) TaxID=572307 RepID=F0VFD3_NEOCL|nr:putative exosome complex exonuclease [Neospora caninum Liverpool]CBZ52427.1 putative exosome complex exonuclease [Neospora caninum Liverpool]|eukprot:XP_003882459.1 putative exosome complex exonuclease [Neospora caninum Liverpool]
MAAASSSTSDVPRRGKGVLCAAELLYLEDGVACNVREDGRACIDVRPSQVDTFALPKCSASSIVRSSENTVLCGVSMQLARPTNAPDEGEVFVTVDCSAALGVDGARGAAFDSVGIGEGSSSTSLQALVGDMVLSSVDKKKLCLVPGKLMWKVFVDCMVLKAGGCLLDAVSLSVHAALRTTTEVAGEPFPAEDVPIIVTVGEIANRYVWDMTSNEESACTGRLLVAVSPREHKCVGIQKLGASLVDISTLPTVMVNSQRVCREIFERLDRQVASQKTKKHSQQLSAFMRSMADL